MKNLKRKLLEKKKQSKKKKMGFQKQHGVSNQFL